MATCVPWLADTSCSPDWDTLDSELQERATDLAWGTLKSLTGGRVGGCPVTYRPCVAAPCNVCSEALFAAPYARYASAAGMAPTALYGLSGGMYCGGTGCSCDALSEVPMPGTVAVIDEVWLDGILMAPETYRLDDTNRLLRVDGDVWPACQNMRQAYDAEGAFSIIYIPGVIPGTAGLWAAGVLAWEYSKACTGGKCRLPAAVTSIVRQGVSMQFDTGMFDSGLTGIREVDAYILSVNPHALKVPPRVFSPDLKPGRYTT